MEYKLPEWHHQYVIQAYFLAPTTYRYTVWKVKGQVHFLALDVLNNICVFIGLTINSSPLQSVDRNSVRILRKGPPTTNRQRILTLLRNSRVSQTRCAEPMSVKVTSIFLRNLSYSVASWLFVPMMGERAKISTVAPFPRKMCFGSVRPGCTRGGCKIFPCYIL